MAFVDALRRTRHRLLLPRRARLAGAAAVRALRQAEAFFALPEADKLALRMAHSPHFRGYTPAGGELTAGAADWREQIDFGDERAVLPGALQDRAEPWRRLQGPNQWSVGLPAPREAVLAWQPALTEVGFTLMRALALALGQPTGRFDNAFAPDPVQRLKLIRYPGRADALPGASEQGVGPHKDSGSLTLLLQHERGGLQVLMEQRGSAENARAHWIDVPPRPGTLVVNLGEALELLSGGFLRATAHRVVSPRAQAERVGGLLPGSAAGRRAAAAGVVAGAGRTGARRHAGPGQPTDLIAHAGRNLLKGRLRPHTDVAARHYADVIGSAPTDAALHG